MTRSQTPTKLQLASLSLISFWLLFYNTLDYQLTRRFLQVPELSIIRLNNLAEVPILQQKTAITATDSYLSASISARSFLAYDIRSGTQLMGKNIDEKLAPASTTKLMTAFVALKAYSPQTLLKFSASDFRFGYNHDFQVGEELTVKNLITAMLVESANEAAFNLAHNYPTGEAGFVKKMNQTAQEMGLNNTHFTNPAGFDNVNHYSTARDLNRLAIAATNNPLLKHIVKLKKTEIDDFSHRFSQQLTSTNQLLLYNPQVVGVKTGTTPGAKEVLITQFKLSNERVIQIIVLGSDHRYEDTLKLYSLILKNYRWISPRKLLESATFTN